MPEFLGSSVQFFELWAVIAFVLQLFSRQGREIILLVVVTVYSIIVTLLDLKEIIQNSDLLKLHGVHYMFSCLGAVTGVLAGLAVRWVLSKIGLLIERARPSVKRRTMYE